MSKATYGPGFGSSRRAYEHACSGLGMTPGENRRGGRGLEIPFAVVDSPLRDLTSTMGRPRTPGAVARACATNRAAIVVPCHRVVREDGTLSGYRWGEARKRRLLAEEKARTAPAGPGEP